MKVMAKYMVFLMSKAYSKHTSKKYCCGTSYRSLRWRFGFQVQIAWTSSSCHYLLKLSQVDCKMSDYYMSVNL